MSKKQLKHIKEYTDTLPPHLLQSLCSANITETDSHVINTKLQERTSSQIASYLHLILIKLRQPNIAARHFSEQIGAQRERLEFGATLQRRVDNLGHNQDN
jgi:hypothetical protein